MIKKVANEVISNTNYHLNELKVGENPSRYNEWMYQNFMIMEAMDQLGLSFQNKAYASYAKRNVDFFCAYQNSEIKNEQIKSMLWYSKPDEMWHCGMIAAFADQQALYPTPEKLKGIKIFEDFLASAPKLKDETFVRFKEVNYNSKAVQIDDIYMVSPFWVRMWKLTNKEAYLEKAISETLKYDEYLWDNKNELMHCLWLESTQKTAAHFWGRGNGWFIMALTDLLDNLPKEHPQKEKLLAIFNKVVKGLQKYQAPDGLWHQVINVKESFTESSCSGMFTYCILKGVNEGWLDQSYKQTGIKGWEGLQTKLTKDFKIKDTCPPTDMSEDVQYYLNRSRITHDQHAIGPFLLAGAELLKLNK
ncbi:glycoside hydrolase family 88/105 protein [Pedobacter glucosidilyticus]|uniref:glycoside hydrolase family 88/105 protein n=1 Tax=Pedobacter glucosidilyticus TaxID=1122941 RepID=UPI0026EC4784|nr:glycoside hydrolase family 88 protein [Pedobacter glucosidilyticus]